MTSYVNQEFACVAVSPLISASTDAVQKASQQRPQPARSAASLAAGARCAEETAPCNTNNPSSHSSASLPTANPGTSLQGTTLQHPHSFRKWMSSYLPLPAPPYPGFNKAFQSDEIFKSIVSLGYSTVAFVLNIAALICWVATVMIP